MAFDHGAQFLRGHDPGFRQVMDAWERDRWIAAWRAICSIEGDLGRRRSSPRYTPGPGMNRICQEYADRLKEHVRYQTRITNSRGWWTHLPPRKTAQRSARSAAIAPHQDHRPPNFLKGSSHAGLSRRIHFVRRVWRQWWLFQSVQAWTGVRPVSTVAVELCGRRQRKTRPSTANGALTLDPARFPKLEH